MNRNRKTHLFHFFKKKYINAPHIKSKLKAQQAGEASPERIGGQKGGAREVIENVRDERAPSVLPSQQPQHVKPQRHTISVGEHRHREDTAQTRRLPASFCLGAPRRLLGIHVGVRKMRCSFQAPTKTGFAGTAWLLKEEPSVESVVVLALY